MIGVDNFFAMFTAFERGEGVWFSLGRDRLAELVEFWQMQPEFEQLCGGADLAGEPASAAEIISRTVALARERRAGSDRLVYEGPLVNILNARGWQTWPIENDGPLAGAADAIRRTAERSNWPCAILVPLDAAAVDALERWARQYGARYAKANTREATAAAIEAALRSEVSVAVAGNRAAGWAGESLDPDEFDMNVRLVALTYEIEEIGYDIEEGERALAALRADRTDRRAERSRLEAEAESKEAERRLAERRLSARRKAEKDT